MKKKTTITEFCRFLSERVGDIPELDGLLQEYMAGVHQQLKRGERFAWWLQSRHKKIFYSYYKKWWLKNPQLWGMVYEGCNADTDPGIIPDWKK